MTAIEIEITTRAHTSRLAEIHAASFRESAWSAEQIEGSLGLPTTRGWTAMESGKPLGFILCQMGPEQIEILTFAVHPEAQRQGIGESLVQKLIGDAITSEIKGIFLEVAADNGAARALYEKLGFRQSGTRPGYYRRGPVTVDAMFYEKTLVSQWLHKGS